MILYYRIAFFIALFSISFLAFLPDYSGLPPIVSISDKINHATAFLVLFILYRNAFKHTFKRIVFSLIAYAVFIEAVQFFLPTRSASVEDIFADSIGLLIGMFLVRWIEKKRPMMGRESIN
ncbi:MAG: VanZ family protein [Sulfuricurvum sp.]|nr:VanZ family protein [Sulfuricurvum sp.]